MPQLPTPGAVESFTLPVSEAVVQLQTGVILGGDIVNVDDPNNQMGVALAILAGRIKEWNFTEPDGSATAISLDNVKRLPMEDMSFLFDKLNLNNMTSLAGEEKKSSSPTSEQPLTA